MLSRAKVEKIFKKKAKKFGGLKKVRIFAAHLRRNDVSNGKIKIFEKTVLLYKKQVPRKYNLSRSVNFFVEIIKVSG